MNSIKIDDFVAKKTVDNISIFSGIHPNILTVFGIVCNILIFNSLAKIKNGNGCAKQLLFLLLLRWILDCLDGEVARKYDKKTELGHDLDTYSDAMLIGIIAYFIFRHYNVNSLYYVSAFSLYMVMSSKYNMSVTHDKLKNNDNTVIDKILRNVTNNSIVMFVAFFVFVILTSKKQIQ